MKAFWYGWFTSSLSIVMMRITEMERNAMWLEIFAYSTLTVVNFTNQNWIYKSVYFIRCMMVYKIFFRFKLPNRMEKNSKSKAFCLSSKRKIELLRAFMVVTYYIKRFRTGAERYNSILMSLLLLVAETTSMSWWLA